MTKADSLLEFLQYDMNEFLPELLEMAEKGEQNAPAVVEQLRGYLKEDAAWRTQLKRHFAKDAPARVKAFLNSVGE